MRIGIIGSGIFGAMTAVGLADRGHECWLIDRNDRALAGVSSIANRVHMGFHYPRHAPTALQCLESYDRFRHEFADAILPGIQNAYFIASEGSLTSPEAFTAFCDRLALPYRRLDAASFRPAMKGVDAGIMTPEVMFGPELLKRAVEARLGNRNIHTLFRTEVSAIERNAVGDLTLRTTRGDHDFDAVVNCGYAGGNEVRTGFPVSRPVRQYERVAVAIVEVEGLPPASLTILDGAFPCLLPLDGRGRHLLYHVDHSVIERHTGVAPPESWQAGSFAAAPPRDPGPWMRMMVETSLAFMPFLAGCRIVDLWRGIRVVLPHAEDSDERPTIISAVAPGYVTVLSGKVVHSVNIGAEVERQLELSLSEAADWASS
ncbi:MAG: FAD-dependent oxidoreductase [Rhizobiales bacterium]|nr:FAD-dependent oxidoreductase [Hyphomicrobiales bacterium]